VAVAGCGGDLPLPGERELEGIPLDAEKTTVLEALPYGPVESQERSVLWGYRRNTYLVAGNTVEVLWLGPAAGTSVDARVRDAYNPVIFLNDRLDGWGWAHFDQRREEWSLPDPDAPPAVEEPEAGDTPPEGDDAPSSGSPSQEA
jgi:hypothetical protein